MAQSLKTKSWTLVVPSPLYDKLHAHLFPGDHDEHGAVIAAMLFEHPGGVKLLAKKLFIAEEGVDYIEGTYGYRKLTPDFTHHCIDYCEKNRLVYIAIHCHGGDDEVGFSSTDLASHERTYPALLDILNGLPVAGLVFANNAVAGDIWLPDRNRLQLNKLVVPGRPITRLYKEPTQREHHELYSRQTLIFGREGQNLLRSQTIGIIGAGGVGSLLGEYLSRLGVGHIIMVDPERIAPSNRPRIVGSRARDVFWLKKDETVKYIPGILLAPKVRIAKRTAKQASPGIKFTAIHKNIVDPGVALELRNCDYIFLAADTAQAALVFNALVNQYLIPGTQVGVKVSVDQQSKEVTDIYCTTRAIIPGSGCLSCSTNLVNPQRLTEEAKTASQRLQQKYIDDEEVHAPSVITLNAVAASHAVDDYLFSVTGMLDSKSPYRYSYYQPLETPIGGKIWHEKVIGKPNCPDCGLDGRLAMGDLRSLPVKNKPRQK